jgi:uncharacterized protein (DUF433 family)
MTGESIIICRVDNFLAAHGPLVFCLHLWPGTLSSRNTHSDKRVLRQSVTLITINETEKSNCRRSRPSVAANFKPSYYVEIPTPYPQTNSERHAMTEAAVDWSKCEDVESVPGKVSGAWVLKGTRVQAQAVVDNARDGFTAEEIATEIFELPLERVKAVLRFAKIGSPSSG